MVNELEHYEEDAETPPAAQGADAEQAALPSEEATPEEQSPELDTAEPDAPVTPQDDGEPEPQFVDILGDEDAIDLDPLAGLPPEARAWLMGDDEELPDESGPMDTGDIEIEPGDGIEISQDGRRFIIGLSREPDENDAQPDIPLPSFRAVIFATGPTGEVDSTDARYWFKAVDCSNTDTLSESKQTYAVIPTTDEMNLWACATNLAELAAGTHTLTAGTYIDVYQFLGPKEEIRYYFTAGGGGTTKYCKATANWDTSAYTVTANPCSDYLGLIVDTSTVLTVHLPSNPGNDPNVRINQVFAYALDGASNAVADGRVLDDKIGTVKIWAVGLAGIPSGWAICDGSSGTVNLSGQFVVGYDSTDVDFNTIGASGGAKTHAHANHDDHTITLATHHHDVVMIAEAQPQAGSGFWVPAGMASGGTNATTNNIGGASYAVAHTAHSTENHLPPYYVMVFIQRIN